MSNHANVLCIDLGGTELKYGLVKETSVCGKGKTATSQIQSYDDFLFLISGLYQNTKNQAEGISLSLPCYVDVQQGATDGGALKYLWHQRLRDDLENLCHCKAAVENDGKAAAIAELHAGSLQGCSNAAVFLLGTGVGGGLIFNGHVYHGKHSTAGEFGLMNVNIENYNGRDSSLRSYCSTRALLARYQQATGMPEMIDGREFFQRVKEDPIAKETLRQFAYNVGIEIFNLGVLLDLEKVAIGGGISQQEVVMETILAQYAAVRANNPMTKAGRTLPGDPEVVKCRFENDSNLIGAYFNYANDRR